MFTILYPERRTVSAATIRTWYADAVENREIDDTPCRTVGQMAHALHQEGIITLRRAE